METWLRRLRDAVYPIYAGLPPGLRRIVRRPYGFLESSPLLARPRWIRFQYNPFGREQRRTIFLEIARFQHINRPIEGYYFEFGCHQAHTMRMAWDCFRHLFDWTYVAFDSFEGLPEIEPIDRLPIWQKGKLATSEQTFRRLCLRHGVPDSRLITVKGFYDRSLTPSLKERLAPRKAAVIFVDCDLYASTVPVLAFAKDFLQPGTVIVFDDWNCFFADPDRGERRAWREFRAANPDLHFEDFLQTGMQKAFVFVGRKGAAQTGPDPDGPARPPHAE